MATSASSSAYLDSAPLHLGRGFRHICFTASSASSNAYLDSASAPSRSWLSPHMLHGFVRIEQRVPRFRFASSRSWLSPHMLHGFVRIEQRVPRFRSASSRSWLSPHMLTASSASSNAYLDSASLHLGRGFRHMHRKEERTSGMQAFLSPLLFSVRVAQCLT